MLCGIEDIDYHSLMFIVHLLLLMLSRHLDVNQQSYFFCLGVVHNSAQIVPEHLLQMDGRCYCMHHCTPAGLHQCVVI